MSEQEVKRPLARVAQPRRKALGAVARALREPPGLRRLPLVKAILTELRRAARSDG
jgi:hypothetical protein